MKKAEDIRMIDADEVLEAVNRAREHAEAKGKPLLMSRVALFLGLTSDELVEIVNELQGKKDDESAQAVCRALKRAKQESRADLEDCLADKGNTTGYMFLGKVNHGMVETTRSEVTFKPVRFSDEDEIPE